MVSFKAVIIDPIGIHARPAALIADEASKYSSNIKIKTLNKEGNLKSIMNIMSLGLTTGIEIEIIAEGSDANLAINTIKKIMQDNKVI